MNVSPPPDALAWLLILNWVCTQLPVPIAVDKQVPSALGQRYFVEVVAVGQMIEQTDYYEAQ